MRRTLRSKELSNPRRLGLPYSFRAFCEDGGDSLRSGKQYIPSPKTFYKTFPCLTVFLPPFPPGPCSYQCAHSPGHPGESWESHMKSIRFRLLIAAMAVLLGSAIARSQTADAPPPPPMHGHGFGMQGHGMGFFAKSLNLTDEQKAQMKTVMQKEHPNPWPCMG